MAGVEGPLLLSFTLVFITRGSQVLMLHRRYPPNQGLWNGVGGHIEQGETPLACCLREVQEETGFHLDSAQFGGILTWQGHETPPGGLYLFKAPAPAGEPTPCAEGELAWRPLEWVLSSPDVVSNLPIVLPALLDGQPPQEYAFEYTGAKIRSYIIRPLPGWVKL